MDVKTLSLAFPLSFWSLKVYKERIHRSIGREEKNNTKCENNSNVRYFHEQYDQSKYGEDDEDRDLLKN